MREIKDNAYIVSFAREDVGRIMIDRTDRRCLCGQNAFDVLGISGAELDFLNYELDCKEERCLALVGRTDRDRAVLLFPSMSYSTAICLAVELSMPIDHVAAVLTSGAFESIVVSDGFRKHITGQESVADIDGTYRYMHDVLSFVSDTCFMKNAATAENPYRVIEMARSVAYFVGVDVECDVLPCEISYDYAEVGTVFAGSFLAASLLIVSMMARRYSTRRSFDLLIERRRDNISATFSFESDGVDDAVLAKLLRAAAASNVYMGCDAREGVYSFELFPHYEDVGLIGLKEPLMIFSDESGWVGQYGIKTDK